MPPDVSVVIAAYNAAGTIEHAVRSILLQNCVSMEIIVVDDGSTDATADVLAAISDLRFVILQQSNAGLYPALERGVAAANGRYIARLDADDAMLPGRLAQQRTFLDANPDYALVGTGERRVDAATGASTDRLYPEDDAVIRRACARYLPYCHSSWMFRRALVDEGINYDPRWDFMGDVDFFQRVARRHRVHNLPEVLTVRRLSTESFFTRRFAKYRQTRRLAWFQARAVRWFDLPVHHYLFPAAKLAYPLVPEPMKRVVRARLGVRELGIGTRMAE